MGYKGHIYREHKDFLNEDLYEKQMQLDTNTHDNEASSTTFSNTHSKF
jgi:hypothetical protein